MYAHNLAAFETHHFHFSSTRMATMKFKTPAVFLCLIFFFLSSEASVSVDDIRKTYIVYVKKPESGVTAETMDLESWYKSFLPVASYSSSNQRPQIVHSYKNVAIGFAAKLTAEEAKSMESKEGFLSARPERMLNLHTAHNPQFLGLNPHTGFWKESNFGEGVIIGVLDSGVNPDHPSFSDEGMPTPPAKWKGVCEFNGKKTCNNKLIGARNFVTTTGQPPYDEDGHGTHTASIAAGNFVKDTNVFGHANGVASGIAPRAHLAIYKVCLDHKCPESSQLAAVDAAVRDAVDIISISIGGGSTAFYDDTTSVAAFGATEKGILVSASAGNKGPSGQSLSNEAPWILTVGASTIDRIIAATAKLGNGDEFVGQTLFQPKDFPSTQFPLVDARKNGDTQSAFCAPGSLANADVLGKIVLCERGGGISRVKKGQTVKDAGRAAMILMNNEDDNYSIKPEFHVLPATYVSYMEGLKIKDYVNSTPLSTAAISFNGTQIGDALAPEVTSFSSRGPSVESPGIMKPDILGPGMSILAAWPFSSENDQTVNNFNMKSGTSMSCPHLSGVAALLKSAHPDWSPTVIKSAIMTSADLTNLGGNPIVDETHFPANIFAVGAGHVNPSKANDPGLVYDIQPEDYISYLCGLGYTGEQVTVITRRAIDCSVIKTLSEAELNYPGFSIKLGSAPQKFTRSLTNVGDVSSVYSNEIIVPQGVEIEVFPDEIVFSGENKIATYNIRFTRKEEKVSGLVSHGHITWKTSRYAARIPITITFE